MGTARVDQPAKRSKSATPKTDQRSLRPKTTTTAHDDLPNTNDPASNPPPTVGPPVATGGDPNGVELTPSPPAPPSPPSWFHASRWSGWPDEWFPPLFGHLQTLTDVAWSCLDLNSSVFAAMPAYLVNASPNLPDDWLANPNPSHYTSWADFARQLMWDYQLGEVFVYATARYANGWPARFVVVPPFQMELDRYADGSTRYRVGGIELDPADVLHVKYQATTDDLRGTGPLAIGQSRMVAASVLVRYATNFATAGGVPSSVLEHPDELTAAQATELRNQWISARLEGLGVPAVLSGGVTWKATQIDPLQSALVELAAFNEARIAVLLQVPPFLVGLPSGGDSMTYSNVSSIFDYHWRAGLKPKAQRLMMALSGFLLPRQTGIEVNRDEYVRPGPLERAQTEQIYLQSGVLSIDEVRAMERFDVISPSPIGLESGVLK